MRADESFTFEIEKRTLMPCADKAEDRDERARDDLDDADRDIRDEPVRDEPVRDKLVDGERREQPPAPTTTVACAITAACTFVDIDRALRSLAERKAALDVEEARWLRLGEQQNAWSKLGYVHALEYLELVFGYGPRVAMERLRVANELGALPELESALEAAEVNYSVVRELTRVATPETVGRWLDAARGKNLRDVERMVSGHRKGDEPEDAPDPKLVKHGVWLELDAESFALYREARAVLDEEAGAKLTDKEFVAAMAGALLRGVGGASNTTRPTRTNHIITCRDCGRGWQDGSGVRVELDAAAVERALCDAIIVDDESGKRARSAIPAKTRRKVLERDQHRCQVPGCNSQRDIEVHLLRKPARRGDRNLADFVAVCGRHHKHQHEGLLAITGRAPDALHFEQMAATTDAPAPRPNLRTKLSAAIERAQRNARTATDARCDTQCAHARADAASLDDDSADTDEASQEIPPSVRRMVMARAEHRCQMPGCRSARNLDVHHRKHRAHGGSNHPDNLIVLCSGHHRLHHLGLLEITGSPESPQVARIAPGETAPVALAVTGTRLTPRMSGTTSAPHRRGNAPAMHDIADAQTALRQMGYKPAIAKRAVDRACAHVGTADLIALIKEALKHCG